MGQATVLIVEDEAIVAADLAGKLGQIGYRVVGTVARGEEAVALACRCRPDVVLMDIWLKGAMDGIEAADTIRRQCDIPVIYLTAHSDAASLERAKVTEPFGYILKPFEERELVTHIEMALYKHQADRQLREQREWLRVTLTSIGDAVIATDAAGRITFVNPVAAALTGWAAADTLGLPLQEVFRVVNEQTQQPLRDPVAQVLQENCTVKLANHAALVRRDGRVVPIEDSAAPILDAAGHLIGAVLVFQDVTEKRRAEEALRDQAEALKEADRRKDEFLATLAHELRNPLAPLCNALGLLHKTDDDVKTFRRVRAMMERQLRQLVHLVDDLLDVSRISCGKIQLRKQNLDLADVVHSAVEIARPVIEAGEHELTVTLPVPPLPVEGDPTRLAQVLGNLLSNAAKYTPNGGRISLVAGQDSKRAVIRVRDNGLGIPREMLPSIFEMFTQVDKHLERAQGGLGIGLTLVRRLVEMHGGTVEAYSEGLGQGSEFVVRLPLQEEKSNSPPQASCGDVEQTGVASAGRRILVVDDNVDATDSLALLLRLQGHEVRTAFDGPSALEVAEAFRPEVMLLDIGLPGMSGYDVARQLRRLPAHQKTILVAQTGWGQEEDRSLSKEAGFDAHLVKPVELAALQQLLAQLSCWRCDSGAMPGETPAG